MNHIYGPVTSRRLGVSLGVSVTPYKYCPLNCVYCQLKHTTKFTLDRKEYVKAESIISEVAQFFKAHPEHQNIDYITLSGSGEPLLNSKIEIIISGIKKLTNVPLALITNSVLLYDKDVRRDILKADLILPSLDAVTQDVFNKIDRPVNSPRINIENVIGGLIELRREFKGKIWLEIMLVKDINDSIEYAAKFKEVIDKINPDKIQLNIPSRMPCEAWVKIPTPRRIKKIQSILGEKCELM
ncbi:MAG: radical SAM protein [Candidatus Omnitrophica bacterium]|nr:radical SAM protein [Candidatus Omnitrophota bacterium]